MSVHGASHRWISPHYSCAGQGRLGSAAAHAVTGVRASRPGLPGTQGGDHTVEFTEGDPQSACFVLESLGTDREAVPLFIGGAVLSKVDPHCDLLELSLEHAEKELSLCPVGTAGRSLGIGWPHRTGADGCDDHESSRVASRTMSSVLACEEPVGVPPTVWSSRVTVGRG